MTTVNDVPPGELINAAGEDLKTNVKLVQPEWSTYVKTGPSRERSPENPDWWWIRTAAVLRKIYLEGPIGVEKLRIIYGGKKNRGRKPEKFVRAGGKILRTALQQLDEQGFTEKLGNKGRRATPKGISYLDKIASSIAVAKKRDSQ